MKLALAELNYSLQAHRSFDVKRCQKSCMLGPQNSLTAEPKIFSQCSRTSKLPLSGPSLFVHSDVLIHISLIHY